MAKKYAEAIIAGSKTIEQVPARWRNAVLELLADFAA